MTDGTYGCELHRFAGGWNAPTLVADLNPSGDAQPGLHLGLVAASADVLLFDATGTNGHRGLWALNASTMDATPLTWTVLEAPSMAPPCSSPGWTDTCSAAPVALDCRGGPTAPSKER